MERRIKLELKQLCFVFFMTTVSLNVFAVAPKGSLTNKIHLQRGSYITLIVTDQERSLRNFMITCELILPSEKVTVLKMADFNFVDLKSEGKQSLVNYWREPAIDNEIICNGRLSVENTPVEKTPVKEAPKAKAPVEN